jgi:hypothetical protein
MVTEGCFGMAKTPKKQEEPEVDPVRGDAILKRMLQTKPKPHRDMIAERRQGEPKRKGKDSPKR